MRVEENKAVEAPQKKLPRCRKLAACAQFKIHNSKFIISPTHPLSSPYLP